MLEKTLPLLNKLSMTIRILRQVLNKLSLMLRVRETLSKLRSIIQKQQENKTLRMLLRLREIRHSQTWKLKRKKKKLKEISFKEQSTHGLRSCKKLLLEMTIRSSMRF